MIVEHRSYKIVMGKLPEYLALFEERALPVQQRILGFLLGSYTTEIGEVPRVHHFWAYRDFAEYETRRALLTQDPAQRAFGDLAKPLVHEVVVQILRPTAYGPNPLASAFIQSREGQEPTPA